MPCMHTAANRRLLWGGGSIVFLCALGCGRYGFEPEPQWFEGRTDAAVGFSDDAGGSDAGSGIFIPVPDAARLPDSAAGTGIVPTACYLLDPADPTRNQLGPDYSASCTACPQPAVGGGYDFNGVDAFLSIPYLPGLVTESNFSFTARVRPRTHGDRMSIVAKSSGNADRNTWNIPNPPNPDGLSMEVSEDGFYPPERWKSLTPLPLDTWSTVTLTYDPTLISLYVDGVSAVSAEPVSMAWSDSPFLLGAAFNNRDQLTYYFDGVLSEVCFFDRTLTPAEVAGIGNGIGL